MIRLTVNGTSHDVEVPSYRTLLDCLRYDLGLTGSKEGCGVGVCGACTVLLDGKMISSCIALAAFADGREVTTVEGLAEDERLHPVQQAFIDFGGFQCGICTPGQVVAAKALLDANPDPSEAEIREWMLGNLCRCTGYYKIVESIRAAAQASRPVNAFDYRAPRRLDEALAILQEYGDEARVVAGGTALVTMLRQRLLRPACLVSLREVPGVRSDRGRERRRPPRRPRDSP